MYPAYFKRPSSSINHMSPKKQINYTNNISTFRPSSSHYKQIIPQNKYQIKRSSSAIHQTKQKSSSKSPQKASLNDKYFSPLNNHLPPQFQKEQQNNYYTNASSQIKKYFLPQKSKNTPRKTLILDLDETLVHSSFKPFPFRSDISFQIKVDQRVHVVNVLKRPYVNEFLSKMSKYFELVIFTASVSPYANPLLDQLDTNKVISHRLFREHCIKMSDLYIKDLRKIGRSMKDMFILDNNPISYVLNKENGLPILTWRFEKNDFELMRMVPLLELLSKVDDVRPVIKRVVKNNEVDYTEVNKVIAEYKEINSFKHHSHANVHNIRNEDSNKNNININIVNQHVSNVIVNDFRDGNNYRHIKNNPFTIDTSVLDNKPKERNNYFYYNKSNENNHPVQINHYSYKYDYDTSSSNNISSYNNYNINNMGGSEINFYHPLNNTSTKNYLISSMQQQNNINQDYPLAASMSRPSSTSHSFYLQERENYISFGSRNDRYHAPLRANVNSNLNAASYMNNNNSMNINYRNNSNSSQLPLRSERFFNPNIRYI